MKDIEQIAEQLKREIHEKAILYISEITTKYPGLSKKETDAIIKKLEADISIAKEGDVLTLLTLKSSTEQDIYSHIIDMENIEMLPDRIKIGNTLYRGFIVVANPQKIGFGVFHQLLKSKNNMIIAMHVSTESSINMVHHLRSELGTVEAKLNYFALQGKIVGKDVDELRDREKFLKDKIEKFSNGTLKAFKLHFTFAVEETNADDLDFTTNKAVAFLKKIGFVVKMAINYQKDVLKTIVPSGANFLRRRPIIVTNNFMSDSFPFVK